MSTVTYTVPGIHCGHCVHTIKMEIGDLEGVQTVDADLASKEVVVNYSEPATPEQILALLAEINYPAQK
jgi:copper chaperone